MTSQTLIETLAAILIETTAANPARVQEQVARCLARNDGRLELVLPLLPASDATTAQDMRRIEDLCRALNRHVPTRLTVASDGDIFSDLCGTGDAEVDTQYRKISAAADPSQVRVTYMADALRSDWLGDAPADIVRQRLLRIYGTEKGGDNTCSLTDAFAMRRRSYDALVAEKMPNALQLPALKAGTVP